MKKCYKKYFLATIILCLSFIQSHASFSIDWIKMPNMLSSMGKSIACDDSNNVYVAFVSDGSIYIEKRDRFGNFLWQQISSTTVNFNYENAVKVFVDPLGNPVVAGYRHTTSSEGHNSNALVVLKYASNGTLIFKKNINGSYSYFNNSQYWTNISCAMDAAGYIYIGTAGNVSGYPDWGFNVVKVDPNGNIVRVSTKFFSSSNNFHFVGRLRIRDNLIGITGVTSNSSANATTWVLDTAGTDLWNNITAGVQGHDVAFDAFGNTFMLTWISAGSGGDVSLTKYDPSGTILWNRLFDFGGGELAAQMEWAPDGNLAVMAYGNQYPGGSLYVDWITFKTDTAGTLLWSDRYDEHGDNDEYPVAMALDATGNIYLTGIGGPFPGGANLGKRQMVTVKYTSAGTRDWSSAIDTITEYLTGTAITIGNDSSVFVIGDSKTFMVHYLDHTGSNPCSLPASASALAVTSDSATITWSQVTNAYLYHVQYKPMASLFWETRSTNSTTLILTDLFTGATYDYRVEAICNSGPTGYTTPQQFTTSGNGYCQSLGLNATNDWIDLVFLNDMLNSTPVTDSGYADYTHLSTTLIPGTTYDIELSAAIVQIPTTESWKVWIDFNRNGDFTDAGEEVVSYSSWQIGWETHSFTVPTLVSAGQTVMRVSMKSGPAQTPCEIFGAGEVEDYTIILSGVTNVWANYSNENFRLFPNPADEFLQVSCDNRNVVEAEIIDVMGRKVYSHQESWSNSLTIDTHLMTPGIYFLRLTEINSQRSTIKFIKH